MISSSLLFTFSSILINLVLCFTPSTSQPTLVYNFCLGANYTTNSNIQFTTNLNLLLSSLSSKASSSTNHGFYNFTTGQNQYKVYGLFLCRGDVTIETCQNCVETASKEIIQLCPVNREAIIWYEECMLRYSNRSIFSIMEVEPRSYFGIFVNVSDPDQLNRTQSGLMDKLITRAVRGPSSPAMFAIGDEKFSLFQNLYGLVQCTPDLSGTDCDKCLRGAVSAIQNRFYATLEVALYRPSCVVRRSSIPFYPLKAGTPAAAPPPPPPPPPPLSEDIAPNRRRKSFQPACVIAIPLAIAVTVLSIICFYVRRRKKKKKANLMDDYTNVDSLQFGFITIKTATDNFSDANKLGAGGFGAVYKGRLSDGQEIAVKRLSGNSSQGEAEFKNEVALLAKLQHRNLVGLIGFCLEGKEKQLIYEFVPNGSLDYFIFDPSKRAEMDWRMHYKIIEGTARGILYLHEDSQIKIIHRDLKPSNILLDADMNPKISDFGMARLVMMDQTLVNTKRVVGTYGYMPPEYALKGLFSVKSDVFSFGVIVLEMISGKKIRSFHLTEDSQTLLEYAWRLWHEEKGLEFIDPMLNNSCPTSEVLKCLLIGLLCVQEDPKYRPTMSSVVMMLKKKLDALPQPRQPAYAMGSSSIESDPFSVSGESSSVNEATFSSFTPR
ncbi:putative receptor-like protein kinase At4g00960 isoform X2 [Macadamia integrifolia]|uniref:putative receptor-like protein kinase At4g00960 isoform X2 n=1 Tax=Macadamia integrifolia TaxID=60698 RepID=UPI001C4EDD80|nr:putative receptor-like protein kinase At4g00960 isoform X2 [Macadamia integrifolia]